MSPNNKTIINGLHLSLLVPVNLHVWDVLHEQRVTYFCTPEPVTPGEY